MGLCFVASTWGEGINFTRTHITHTHTHINEDENKYRYIYSKTIHNVSLRKIIWWDVCLRLI